MLQLWTCNAIGGLDATLVYIYAKDAAKKPPVNSNCCYEAEGMKAHDSACGVLRTTRSAFWLAKSMIGIYLQGASFWQHRVPPERQAEAGWGRHSNAPRPAHNLNAIVWAFSCDETRAVTPETVTSGRHTITHRISPMVILCSLGIGKVLPRIIAS